MTTTVAVAPSPAHERFRARYGPWAVVTGASEGIGREFAECLAQRGFNLVLVARRQALLDEMAARYTAQHGVKTRVFAIDLSESGFIDAFAEATAGLDVGLLVAAAGYGSSGPLIDSDLADELRMVDVNCKAVLAMSSHFGTAFAHRRRSGLVLMSSLLAFQGVPRAANYAATKAYVQTLAEGLRVEWAARGVDVVACAPGPIESGFGKRANMRMGMAGQPAEVARATLAALGRRSVVRPGWLSKLLEASLAGLPRRGRVWILTQVMRGMTRHQDGQAEGRNGETKGQARRLA